MIAAAYLRKSNDEGERSNDVKSIEVQRALALSYAERQGWTLDPKYQFADDGISGAEFLGRPGLQALLAALKPTPPFSYLIVSEQSRLGRETLDTLLVIREIERAGVKIFSVDGRAITMQDDTGEIMAMLDSWRDTGERKKAIVRVRNAAFKRHDSGYVAGGQTYGYRNERLPGAGKQPVRRIVNDEQAAIVRRIFEMMRDGCGIGRIAKTLNNEGIPGPRSRGAADSDRERRGTWEATGVREILKRTDYRGEVIFGRVRRDRKDGKKVRIHLPESEWKRRTDESLRIVSDELWTAAHARMADVAKTYLRDKGKLLGQREKGGIESKHLLSGFLVCGYCGWTLHAEKRGRKNATVYACSAHRTRGDAVCKNTTGVPADKIHAAVVQSLRDTFSVEHFERHLRVTAEDEQAREQRRAERAALLDKIPRLAAAEAKLAKAIAVSDSVEAIVAEIKVLQQERKEAEARVSELEGWELDARAEADAIERLRATWGSWQGALDADPVLARQILRKIVDPKGIRVFPAGRGGWEFRGYGRYDGVLLGSIYKKHPEWTGGTSARFATPQGSAWEAAPIAGGSDECNLPGDTEMAPTPPAAPPR